MNPALDGTPPGDAPPGDAPLGCLVWRCRRGMRELDLILKRWLENHYSSASSDARAQFARFLQLPDPDIAGYLLGRETPADPAFAALVGQMAAGGLKTAHAAALMFNPVHRVASVR